jgi:hypothetical protein
MVDLKRVYKASNKDLAEAELDTLADLGQLIFKSSINSG